MTGKRAVVEFSNLCRMSLDNRVTDQLELYYRLAGFDDDGANYDVEAQNHTTALRRLKQKAKLWIMSYKGAS